jgi:hypothetical protein
LMHQDLPGQGMNRWSTIQPGARSPRWWPLGRTTSSVTIMALTTWS